MLARYTLSSSKISRPEFVKTMLDDVLFKKNFPISVPAGFHTCVPSPHAENTLPFVSS